MKDERFSCDKAIKVIRKEYAMDPVSLVSSGKRKVRVERLLGPNLKYMMVAESFGFGILFTTRFGIRVDTDDQGPLLSAINELNADYLRGKFYVDGENELVFENFLYVDRKVSRTVLLTEMALGFKMFLKDMSQIVGCIKSPGQAEEEYTILESDDDEEEVKQRN